MGSGIAGQAANAGSDVLLLDLPSKHGNPNLIAENGYKRLLDPGQPGLMDKQSGQRIQFGNTRDDLGLLSDCDWVAEAVVERLEVKRELYRKLNNICKDGTVITSNTSTIPIRLLVEGMPYSFARRFAITHFFNPVRFMRLLELVGGRHTDSAVLDNLDAFCEQNMGKGVVRCRDTPGFLGNRVGVYAIQCALHTAFRLGLKSEEADAIFGRPMGMPKTGVFGLYDLIGVDLMADVVKSLTNILPQDDAFHAEADSIPLMQKMIANGQTGNKQGRGFYHNDQQGNRLVLDRQTEEYKSLVKPHIALVEKAETHGVTEVLNDESKFGEFAWQVLSKTLCYAASLIPQVTDNPVAIDDAMKLGYNWVKGPFEMLDSLDLGSFIGRLESEGRSVPQFLADNRKNGFYFIKNARLSAVGASGEWVPIIRPQGVERFSEIRQTLRPENTTETASWFICDGMAVVEFHSKANVLDAAAMAILGDAITQVEPMRLKGLLVHNDARHFSCGVNLSMVREYFRHDDMDGLDHFLRTFQQTVIAMRNANFPVVVAPVGLSIGGGFEVVLHGKQVICHANSVMGLVESTVGLVPSGGGCKEMLYRWIEKLKSGDDIAEASWKAFMNTGYGKTASSPQQAVALSMMRNNDSYEMNRDRIYSSAVRAIESAKSQQAFKRSDLLMPGQPVFDEMREWLHRAHKVDGILTAHDIVVGTEIARIMSGGDIISGTCCTEQEILDSERTSFLSLVQNPATQARINGMLDAGETIGN